MTDETTNDTGATITEGVVANKERTNDETTNATNDSAITECGTVVDESMTNEGVGMDTLNGDNNKDSHNCSILSESVHNNAISGIDAIKDKFQLFLAHQARCQCQSMAILLLEDEIKELCMKSKG